MFLVWGQNFSFFKPKVFSIFKKKFLNRIFLCFLIFYESPVVYPGYYFFKKNYFLILKILHFKFFNCDWGCSTFWKIILKQKLKIFCFLFFSTGPKFPKILKKTPFKKLKIRQFWKNWAFFFFVFSFFQIKKLLF